MFSAAIVAIAAASGLVGGEAPRPEQVSVSQASPARSRVSFAGTPLSFEPNVGQSGAQGKFIAHGAGYSVQLEPSSARISFGAGAAASRTVTIDLVNASHNAGIAGETLLPGTANYFPSSDPKTWHANIPTYSKVRSTAVYPGVDVAFYGNASRLEYDFLLQPGADARRIRMALGGAEQVRANESGDLVMQLANGDVRLLKPAAWQTSKDGKRREDVEAGYRLERTAVGEPALVSLALGRYDHARPLVIDPTVFPSNSAPPPSGEALVYSEYLSSNVASVAADNSGNTWVTGTLNGSGFYVTKFNASGAVVYTTTIGTNWMYPARIAVDGSGLAYVAGQLNSGATLPTGANSFQSSTTASYCAFYVQIASSGASVPYATFLDGTDGNYSWAYGLAVDSSGNSYITGQTNSTTFPVTAGAYQNALSGTGYNGFVAKINPAASGSASLVYSTYLGPSGTGLQALAIDGSGDAYVTGFAPNGFPVTAGAFAYTGYQSSSGGVYVTKLNPTGTALVYSAHLGYGTAYGMALDGSGNAYVTGTVGYDDFPTTPGAYQTSYPGGFVTELAASGASEVYSTFLGGPSSFNGSNLIPESIALPNGCTSNCNAYVSGWTSTSDFPTLNAIQTSPSISGSSAFLVELAGGGTSALFSSYLSGLSGGVSEGFVPGQTPALAVDSSGNISVVGNIGSGSDFPITISSANSHYGFLAKISPSSAPYIWGVPASINFAYQPVGVSTSISNGTATVELRNISSTAATLQPVQASPPSIFFESDSCSGSIAAGGSCTLDVDFTPGGPGTRSGTVTVTSNASDSPLVIALTGTGYDTAYIQPSPASLTFGNQNVGTPSSPQSVTLTNIGDETASLSVGLNNGTDFSQLNNCPTQLLPGNSCLVNVTFDPTQAGLRTDTLYTTGGGPGVYVPISGSGTVSGSNAQISLSAASLNFPNEPVGVTSPNQVVWVTNNGNVAVTLQSLNVSGDFLVSNDYCGAPPVQLNPQTTCSVYVDFTPSATGARTGTLTFVDSASGSPQTVTLNGTGLAAVQAFEFYPFTAMAFPDTPVGITSGVQTVYAYNVGTLPINIDRVLVSGDFQITYTYCPGSTLGGTLNDGSSLGNTYSDCWVYVTFTPTATGARTGTLTFTDSAPGSPHVVSLSGNGIVATGAAVLTPTQLVFPAQAVGITSPQQLVQIANPGNTPVTINSWSTGASDFAVASNYTCPTPPFTQSAGSNCQIQISFTPTVGSASPGTNRTGTLTVSSSAGTVTTGLTGTGLTATQAIGFTPAAINFGSVVTGQTTSISYYPLYVRNTGTQAVTFTDDGVLTGNVSDFTVSNYTCPGASGQLQPGMSCYLYVQFTPGAAGSRSATLTFHNSAGSQAMALSGTGVSTLPNSTTLPAEMAFNSQVQGTTNGGNYVYFTNNSASSVALGNIALTGDFLIPSGNQNCNGQTISAGGNCYAYVSFAPTASGYRTGTLTFLNNVGTTLISVPLAGYAPAPVTTAYLDPTAVAFPANQVVGTTTSSGQWVYLYNSGNLPLTVGALTGTNLGATSTNEFSITAGGAYDGCSSQTIAVTSNCYVYVLFTPNAAGARSGTIVFPVTYSGGATQNFTATLTGTGMAERNSAVLSPTAATFIDQAVGTTSPSAITFTLTNSGNLPFTVGAISGTNLMAGASKTGEFSASATTGGYDGCSGTSVAVSNNCYVNVTFTPSAAGAQSGSIAFPVTFADATTATPSATLAGKGVAATATLQISPAAVQFPVQITGTTSAAQWVVATNTGNVPVHFATDSISGDFQIGSDSCSNTQLNVPSNCNISVTFKPSTIGARTGTLTLADNATGGPHSVSLSGTGIPAIQQVAVSPGTLAFANQPAASTSSQQAVWVTNQGDTTVSALTAGLSGTNSADFKLTNNCPSSLAARSTCTLLVVFAPAVTATGARTASISIGTSVSGESSLSVTLTGTAVVAGPAAALHPPSLTFAQQNVGTTSAAQQMSVTNTGSANLTITGVVSTNATEFPLSLDGCSGDTLTPGQLCTVSLKFLPSVGGPRSSTIQVTDNAPGSPQSLSATGTGYGIPVAALSPATVPFGSSNIGTATASQNVTLTNTGTDALTITSVALTGANTGDFAISSNGCGATLPGTVSAPHPSCVIAVTFNPTAGGSRGASLTVTDNANNAPGSTQSTALTGTGVAVPTAGLSTGTLPSFGNVNIGVTSAAQTVTVSNTGTGPLTIASIAVGGTNPGDFGQTNNCGATLNNGATCTISVTFTPTVAGARSATITLTDNAGNVAGATQVINASGTGVAVPGVTAAPSSLTFTNQNVNSTSAAQAVTLTNNGTGALTIASIAFTGTNPGDFGKTTTCGATLAGSGGTCTISVTFTPTAAGSRTATLVVTDNAGNVTGSQQQVTLNGTAVGVPVAGVSTSSILFGNQNLGTTSALQPVTLNNTTGTGPLTISSISIGGANPGDFGETNNCGTSVAIGGSCTINVTFAPTAAGSRSGTLIISDNSNNAASSQTVNLTSTGVAVPMASPSPGTLPAFNSTPVGATSSAQQVTLTSTGTGALTITSIAIGGTNPGDFAQTNNCPGTLVVGASCTISVTFTPTATGIRSGTLIITDNSGNVAGAQQGASLTGTGATAPGTPVPVSISPINGSGSTQTFTLTYLDDNGISDVKNLYVLFNPTSSMAYGCDVSYYQTATSNRIYLANDAGTAWLPSVSVASSTPLANSQCTVTASGITSSGNELTLSLTITFAAGFSGQKNVYMEAIGASGNSGWVLQGTWTTAARQTLTAGSVLSPSLPGAGISQTFSLSFPDANGVSDIGKGFVLFNASLTGAGACYVEFSAPKSLYLRNDGNTAWSSAITVGSATPLSNSQCTLTGSSLTAAPGGYTLGLSLTFSGTFTGSKNVYMEAEPVVGTATGFKLEGTWTP
ncbi:MAG: choice-of-anchor D domain-containing protein [Bryobacteraceae bacterium]